MICYRIRDEENRFSLMATGKYMLKYSKGAIATAPKETLGIFCFKTKEDAHKFKNKTADRYDNWEIYRVKGIGKGKIPNKICCSISSENINLFYVMDLTKLEAQPPKGLICYNQIEVLN